ncbi:MAG: ABC transporter ATP-binding protein, partial [Thermotoga sp.]
MQPILSMNNISKTYPGGIEALKKASFEVYEGEIHALVGENGAGKTTMMNILYGLVKPDEGEIKIRGKRKVIRHPRDAIENGIGMVHQHFMLVPELTVLENILLGFEKKFVKSFWRIDKKAAEEKARELMKSLGMELPLDTPVDFLPIGYKQRTEIVKTLFRGIDILILDEPTSVLAPMEIKEFLL